MACEEGQHDRRLIVGIEVGPVHGDLDALTRSDDGRHPEHKQFLDINSRVREQPIDLLDGMLAYTSLRQSQSVADGAHGQGCTGHHTNGGVCQRLNPLRMQAFAEQSIDKPVCMLKLGRPHANNHWYLPRRVTGRLLYCQPVFNPLGRSCRSSPSIGGFRFFSERFSAFLILLLLKTPENEGMLEAKNSKFSILLCSERGYRKARPGR